MTSETWLKCGPFEGMWSIEEASGTGRIVAETPREADADRIIEQHQQAQQVAALATSVAALLDKLAETTPASSGIYVFAHAHGVKYDGPTFEAEEQAVREALAAISGKETT